MDLNPADKFAANRQKSAEQFGNKQTDPKNKTPHRTKDSTDEMMTLCRSST
jgi:hypothetical protein